MFSKEEFRMSYHKKTLLKQQSYLQQHSGYISLFFCIYFYKSIRLKVSIYKLHKWNRYIKLLLKQREHFSVKWKKILKCFIKN